MNHDALKAKVIDVANLDYFVLCVRGIRHRRPLDRLKLWITGILDFELGLLLPGLTVIVVGTCANKTASFASSVPGTEASIAEAGLLVGILAKSAGRSGVA